MKKDTFKALRDKVINIRESNYVDEIVSIIVEKLMKQLPNIKNSNEVYSLEYSFSEYDKKDIIEACKIIESKVPGLYLLCKNRRCPLYYTIIKNNYYKFSSFSFLEKWIKY
jgi:hypothetical protein